MSQNRSQQVISKLLANINPEISNYERGKYKSLLLICFACLVVNVLYLLISLFILNNYLQSAILMALISSGVASIYFIISKGWLILPSILSIGLGLIFVSVFYLLSEEQLFQIGIWFLIYLILASYLLPKKYTFFSIIYITAIICIKVLLIQRGFFIFPMNLSAFGDYLIDSAVQLTIVFLLITFTCHSIFRGAEKASFQSQKLIKDKDVLLQEVHHRVRNNLQVIIGLIDLQMNQVNNEDGLRLTKGRVNSISIVHENLHSSENLLDVKPHNYLSDIINNILSIYNSSFSSKMETEDENYSLPADKAISLGLILNELTTHSVKDSKALEATIETSITFQKNKTHISYFDNGYLKVDNDLFKKSTSSLGIKIIINLVSQLKGEIEQIPQEKGLMVRIIF